MRKTINIALLSLVLAGATTIVPSRVDLEGIVKKLDVKGPMGMSKRYYGVLETNTKEEVKFTGDININDFKKARDKPKKYYMKIQCQHDYIPLEECRVNASKIYKW